MRWNKITVLFFIAATFAGSLSAADARIVKVLPHYLDLEGRHALSPSLFDRDAYQVYLRQHPEERSGIRFDVRWKAPAGQSDLKIRIELRGLKGKEITSKTLETAAGKRRAFGRWTPVTLAQEEFKTLGSLTAWKATLWSGDRPLAEQKSFLW